MSFHLQIGTLLESPKPLLLLPWPTNCYIALIGRIIISSLVGDNHEQWQKKMNPWTLIERKRKVGHFMNFAYVCNLWTECATHASVVSQKRRKTPSWAPLPQSMACYVTLATPIVSRDLDASKLTQGLLHIIIIIGVPTHERSHPTLFSFPICSSLLVNVFWYLPTFLYYISHINLVKFIFPPTNNNT